MEDEGDGPELAERLLAELRAPVREVPQLTGREPTREARQVEREGDQGRRGPVVQLARDPPPLLVLRDEESRRQLVQGVLGVLQLGHFRVAHHDATLVASTERSHPQDEPSHAHLLLAAIGEPLLLVASRDRLADPTRDLGRYRDLGGRDVAGGDVARPDPGNRQ